MCNICILDDDVCDDEFYYGFEDIDSNDGMEYDSDVEDTGKHYKYFNK